MRLKSIELLLKLLLHLSVRLSVCNSETAWKPLEWRSENLILRNFIKIY